MGVKVSTGFQNSVMAVGSVKSLLTGLVIKIYSGTEPATANDSLGAAVKLVDCVSAGLGWEANAVNGVLQKDANQVWDGTVAVEGDATFVRIETAADTGGFSTTAVRLQGDVGIIGRFLNLSSTELLVGQPGRIDYGALAFPSE